MPPLLGVAEAQPVFKLKVARILFCELANEESIDRAIYVRVLGSNPRTQFSEPAARCEFNLHVPEKTCVPHD